MKQWCEINKQIDNIRFLPRPSAKQLDKLKSLQEIKKQMLLKIGRKHCG